MRWEKPELGERLREIFAPIGEGKVIRTADLKNTRGITCWLCDSFSG